VRGKEIFTTSTDPPQHAMRIGAEYLFRYREASMPANARRISGS
jgi:hypothetical protein